MSNKKSRKLINIMLSAMMLLGINATEVAAQTTEYGKNGVAYILLSSDFSRPGVYRMNEYDGSLAPEPWRLYTLNGMAGKKVSGLAANQNNQVFLLTTNSGGQFADAPVGWLPTGIKFDENSSIYIKAAGPKDGGANNYWRDGYPSWHTWPTDGNSSSGQYWKRDQTYSGKTFEFAVNFGGPVGVKYLNGSSGTVGTPVWDGKYWPEDSGTSNAAAIAHPSDRTKIILPSHCAALSYYLYGTKNEPAIQGLPMDGTNGRDTYIFTQANGAGYFSGDTKHRAGTMFGCLVKRIYQKRENSLDLYSANDGTTQTSKPKDQQMSQNQANVLQTVDVKVRESYGKLCGDNCIDGGEIEGNKPIETALSTVTVVTSTNGNRYGYNPLGNTNGGNAVGAALRVVNNSGTSVINTSSDNAGQNFSSAITNRTYLAAKGVTPIAMKTIGVSSNFTDPNSTSDFIYGSEADRFVVQDSWWGKGGVAYEYYEGTDDEDGKIVKLDYMGNTNPTPEDLGDLSGDVDAIAIDGDGYLYALKTEQNPTDFQMKRVTVNATSDGKRCTVDAASYKQNSALPAFDSDDFEVELSGWRRDQTTTTANSEVINDSYINIADGNEQPGDYKVAKLKQKIYKSVKRYPQGTGSLGTEEPRGSLFAGYDTWFNYLKKTSSGVTWSYPIWQQEAGTRTSEIPAELAVVNVADSPISIEGTDKHYVMVTGAKTGNSAYTFENGQSVAEDDVLTFKVEGYKPFVNGEQRDFRYIGDISNSLKDVKLNTIPAEDGSYAHDENLDGFKSGFPSNMFEAKNKDTEVTWKIAQVEDTEAVPLSSAKIIKHIETGKLGTGDYKSISTQFKQPGRYIIQAEVKYNYFDNFGRAARPSNLTCAVKSFVTEPLLISVYAKSLNLDKSPSYITNINMNFSNHDDGMYGVTGSALLDKSDFDCVEGPASNNNERKFGDLKISFDAQFFREEQAYQTSDLSTHDGIGVWDYEYYEDLYQQARASIPSIATITIPANLIGKHVYNYKNNSGIDTCYDATIYNPGKSKTTTVSGRSYTAGTAVEGMPTDLDLQFIQYALYLRPVTPQGAIDNDQDQFTRNKQSLIKCGTFEGAKLNEIGLRKYEVSLSLSNIDSYINIPRDPNDYTIDLEIIYPRVTWLNNDLGANLNDRHNYYSSIVPYTAEANAGPVHIVSKLKIEGVVANNPAYNQSSSISNAPGGEELFYDKVNHQPVLPYFTLRARDKEKPELSDNPQNLPYIETTGDNSVAGEFNFTVTDNNPFLTSIEDKKKSDATKVITQTEALSASDIYIQHLKSGNNFSNDESNKEFEICNEGKTVTISQTSDAVGFNRDDDWRLTLAYNVKQNPLNSDFAPVQLSEEDTYKENENLEMENWVGSLTYTITGKVFDGYGIDSKNSAHYFYNPLLATYSGYPYTSLTADEINESISSVNNTYLERIDNDPPSIEVEMVSQSDNRRWVFQLIEGINDGDSCPNTVAKLAKSQLIVKQYALDKGNATTGLAKTDVDGSTNYYDKGFHDLIENQQEQTNSGFHPSVTVNKVFTDQKALLVAVPTVRRAARLFVNVKILDNCGYLPLQKANIKITGEGAKTLESDIKCDASHDINTGNIYKDFKNNPRGVFVVDMPMKVSDTQPQMEITVYCKDNAGNERELVIPFNITESSFETRVLETKEERK